MSSSANSNELYIFTIIDNDNAAYDNKSLDNLMLYRVKDSLLTPLVDAFEQGSPTFLSFDSIISSLVNKKINTLNTYSPNYLEQVCSHPYEIGDFSDDEIERGADFHRFYHLEFSPSKKQEEILKENNIRINYLKNYEVESLEKLLKFHY